MHEIIKQVCRRLLSFARLRNFYCYLRVLYFCKLKKNLKDFGNISDNTWKHTLDSNKRAVYDKNINLPKHPNRKTVFQIGKSLGGSKSNLLIEAVQKKYDRSEFKNIASNDLLSYSPLIQLGDMHKLDFDHEEFDIVLMGWCLAYSNDKEKVLSEVKKVLKPNGIMVIGHTVLSSPDNDILEKRGYLVASPFVKINSLDDLDSLSNIAGFKMFYSKVLDRKIIYGASK